MDLKHLRLTDCMLHFDVYQGNFVRTGHILTHMDIMLRGLVYIRRVLNWDTGNKVAS